MERHVPRKRCGIASSLRVFGLEVPPAIVNWVYQIGIRLRLSNVTIQSALSCLGDFLSLTNGQYDVYESDRDRYFVQGCALAALRLVSFLSEAKADSVYWQRSASACENVFSVFQARELTKIEETLINTLDWSLRRYLIPHEFVADYAESLSMHLFPDGQQWSDLGGPFPYLEAPTAVTRSDRNPEGVPPGQSPFAWRVTVLSAQILLSLMATHSGLKLLRQLESVCLDSGVFSLWWKRFAGQWSPIPFPEAVSCAAAASVSILGTKTAAMACTHEAERAFVGMGSSAHFSEFGRPDQRGTVAIEGIIRFTVDRADRWARNLIREYCSPPPSAGFETATLVPYTLLREATFKVMRFYTSM